MARPRRCRRICAEPAYDSFLPEGIPCGGQVTLTLDEYEVIRLIDLEKLTHEQCARQMDISRTTVTEVYEAAREKIADCIVNGRPLLIAGGNYRFCDVAKNVLIADHIPVIFVLYCSASWYDSLSDEDKALFDEAFQAYYAETQRVYAEKAAWTLRECKEKYGMNITYLSPEEKKRWIEKSKVAYESLTPAQTAVCEEIREALKQ